MATPRSYRTIAAAAHRTAAQAHLVAAAIAATTTGPLRIATDNATFATGMARFADTDALGEALDTSLGHSNAAWMFAGYAGRAKLATKIEQNHRAAADAHTSQAKLWSTVAA